MTWIYFCLIDEERIKIGKANSVKARMRQYERGTLDMHDVRLLAAVEGSAADERHVQRFFQDEACDSVAQPENGNPPEMFKPSPRLTNYIRWLRNQWFTIVEVDGETDGKVSFECWQPNEDRQTPPTFHPLFAPDWLEFPTRVVTADDYWTSPKILDRARLVMGRIDLDPASHPVANKHVKAAKFYTKNDNGLEQRWGGRVWLNPPFSEWQLWVPKITSEVKSGRVQEICVYSAMRTVTAKYFRPMLDLAEAVCIITGRIKNEGLGTDSPDDGHCVMYVGNNVDAFCEVFSEIGSVWKSAQVETCKTK